MPARRHWPGLGFAVADNAGDDQIRIIEDSAIRMGQGIAQFAALVNGPRRFGRNVTWNSTGKAELLEELLHPHSIPADVGVNLAVGAFQVRIGDQGRTTVPRPDDIDHVQVVFLDDPVQVDIEEVEAWRGSPVAKEARLDVRPRERFPQEGVVVQVNLANRQVVRGPPIGMDRP